MGYDAAVMVRARNTPVPAAASTPRHRVLMTADTLREVWPYALELSAALIARGHEVVLATMGAMPSREQRREAAAVPGLGLHASAYKLPWMEEPWNDVHAAGKWLLKLANDIRPSVIHLNDFGHADLAWPAPVLSVAHSCALSWWRAVHGAPPPPAWSGYRQAVAASLTATDLLVAPTYTMLRALERHYGVHGSARVIANGRGGYAEDTSAKGPWILAAGRMNDAGRNLDALAAVAAGLAWPVYIADSGQHGDGARIEFDNVRMLGPLSSTQVRRWLVHTPIYASPARYEPLGTSVLDAALARCALVLGDVDSARELWDGAAMFVAPDDHDALSHTLQQLIADASLRERYAAMALRRAQHYTPALMADAYVRAYNDVGLPQCASFGLTAERPRDGVVAQAPAACALIGSRQENRYGNAAFSHVRNRQPDRYHDYHAAWHGRSRAHRGSRRPNP